MILFEACIVQLRMLLKINSQASATRWSQVSTARNSSCLLQGQHAARSLAATTIKTCASYFQRYDRFQQLNIIVKMIAATYRFFRFFTDVEFISAKRMSDWVSLGLGPHPG